MDTEALRWFQLVADGVTVTEVSAMEHTTQSGVSRALGRLEKEVGTPLLHRSGRTLRMTHAGVAFKRHVDVIMHELDDALAAVEQLVDPETGTVTLAFQPSLGTWLVPDLVGSFRTEHPDVRFHLRPKRDELVTAVTARGDTDLELSWLRPADRTVGWRRIAREPLRLSVPVDHPLASRSEVALADLDGLRLVAMRRTALLRRVSDELCTDAGLEPAVVYECDDLAMVEGFVAAGLGVAIVPAPRGAAPGTAAHGVRHLEISDPRAVVDVGMAWSTERRLLPAAELFRDHVTRRAASGLLPAPAPVT
jgi:LysR family transcriptional regulator, transcription activator of glutamate synthase operon